MSVCCEIDNGYFSKKTGVKMLVLKISGIQKMSKRGKKGRVNIEH